MGLEGRNALSVAILRTQQAQLKLMAPITRALVIIATEDCFRLGESVRTVCMLSIESGPTQQAQDQGEFGAVVNFVFQQLNQCFQFYQCFSDSVGGGKPASF